MTNWYLRFRQDIEDWNQFVKANPEEGKPIAGPASILALFVGISLIGSSDITAEAQGSENGGVEVVVDHTRGRRLIVGFERDGVEYHKRITEDVSETYWGEPWRHGLKWLYDTDAS